MAASDLSKAVTITSFQRKTVVFKQCVKSFLKPFTKYFENNLGNRET